MPTYVALINWTDQGRKQFTHTIEGYRGAQKALAESGIEFKAIYWTLGHHDLIAVIEATDDEAVAAAMLAISSPGGIRTVTLRAFLPEEIETVLSTADTIMNALSASDGAAASG